MTKDNPIKKDDPLTVVEMQTAADLFFPLFQVVQAQMPKGSKTEDTLKVMETISRLAHKARAEAKDKSAPFGFNKKEETDDDENSN